MSHDITSDSLAGEDRRRIDRARHCLDLLVAGEGLPLRMIRRDGVAGDPFDRGHPATPRAKQSGALDGAHARAGVAGCGLQKQRTGGIGQSVREVTPRANGTAGHAERQDAIAAPTVRPSILRFSACAIHAS